jgi:hypothetical protein
MARVGRARGRGGRRVPPSSRRSSGRGSSWSSSCSLGAALMASMRPRRTDTMPADGSSHPPAADTADTAPEPGPRTGPAVASGWRSMLRFYGDNMLPDLPTGARPSVIGGSYRVVVAVSPRAVGLRHASTATIFDLTGWQALCQIDAESTSRHARRDEFEPRLEEVVVVAWALAGLTRWCSCCVGQDRGACWWRCSRSRASPCRGRAPSHVRRPLRLPVLYDPPCGIDFNGNDPPATAIFCTSATTSG